MDFEFTDEQKEDIVDDWFDGSNLVDILNKTLGRLTSESVAMQKTTLKATVQVEFLGDEYVVEMVTRVNKKGGENAI